MKFKYDKLDWEHKKAIQFYKISKQKILELETRVKLLEKRETRAEHFD